MLINPPLDACILANRSIVIVPEETTVVGTFLTQLKLLLGIPEPVIITSSYIMSYAFLPLFIIFDCNKKM